VGGGAHRGMKGERAGRKTDVFFSRWGGGGRKKKYLREEKKTFLPGWDTVLTVTSLPRTIDGAQKTLQKRGDWKQKSF